MIKASELRIGNLVERFDFGVVNGIDLQPKWVLHEILSVDIVEVGMYHDHYRPVPLSEDWLLKFGFTNNGGMGYKAPTNTSYWWFSLRNGFIPSIWSDRTIPSDGYMGCKYVHQLQNLYFALTGIELQLNGS
jgi:hypothetical protein